MDDIRTLYLCALLFVYKVSNYSHASSAQAHVAFQLPSRVLILKPSIKLYVPLS